MKRRCCIGSTWRETSVESEEATIAYQGLNIQVAVSSFPELRAIRTTHYFGTLPTLRQTFVSGSEKGFALVNGTKDENLRFALVL